MKYFLLEPEVAGELGENAIINRDSDKMTVVKLHHVFSGWLGDDLIECFPVFIVSENLHKSLSEKSFNGYSIDEVEISTSYEFRQLYPDKVLPEFKWMKVYGIPGKDDLGSSKNGSLVVSEKVLDVLKTFNVSQCDIEEYLGE